MTQAHFSGIGHAVACGRDGLFALATTPTPYNPFSNPTAPPEVQSKVGNLMNLLGWVSMTIAVVGVVAAAIGMFVSHHRGGGSEHMSRLGFVAGGIVLMATASSIIGFVLS